MRIDIKFWRPCAVALLTMAGLTAGVHVASAARSSALDDPSLGGRDRYDRCLALLKREAARAADEAGAWYNAGGGTAALHCQALALIDLKRYGEAAQKLDGAAAGDGVPPALHAELLDQAGNAWLLARNAAKAETDLTGALGVEPKDEDVLSDRARERGLAKDWSGAFDDLTAVLAVDPERADIYVLRASALHAEGHKAEARADIAHALAIYPGYPEALVERGAMRLESNDRAGARADWQDAAKEAPDSDAGVAARARLEALAKR